MIRRVKPLVLSAAVSMVIAAGPAISEDTSLRPPGAKPGECYTRIYLPPRYGSKIEEVVVADGTEHVEVIPAEYETVEEKVPIHESYTTWKTGRGPIQKIDASTGEIMCLVEGERVMKIADGGLAWRQILCENNMPREVVGNIRKALKDQGIYKGPIDGALGPMTMSAVRSFQRSKNLAAGQLTMDTLSAFGVKL